MLGIRTGHQSMSVAPQWVLYPGTLDFASATSFPIASGERRDVGDFMIPESLAMVDITGIVRDRDGRPVSRASVILADGVKRPGDAPFSHGLTDANGRFRLPAQVGQSYGIAVSLETVPGQAARGAAVPPFTAARNLPPIEITLPD